MKELNKDENLSITGGYFPPTEEQWNSWKS